MRIKPTEWPITRTQLRAGRTMAGLGMRELSALTRVSTTAIANIESGKSEQPHVQTLERLRDALQMQGIEFLRGGWVRHRDDHDHQIGEPEAEHIKQRAIIENALMLARRLVRILSRS
jgi:transcriptional regulator with XRE-family HTH domain